MHSVRQLLVMSSYLSANRAEECRIIPECEREIKHADRNAYFSSHRSEMHAAGHERYQHFTLLMQKVDLSSPTLSNKFVYTCSFDKYFSIHKLLVLVKYSLKIQQKHLTVTISEMISSENPLFDPLV
jgi:hypothetical protein